MTWDIINHLRVSFQSFLLLKSLTVCVTFSPPRGFFIPKVKLAYCTPWGISWLLRHLCSLWMLVANTTISGCLGLAARWIKTKWFLRRKGIFEQLQAQVSSRPVFNTDREPAHIFCSLEHEPRTWNLNCMEWESQAELLKQWCRAHYGLPLPICRFIQSHVGYWSVFWCY